MTSAPRPALAVAVCTYNRAQLLDGCLAALARQADVAEGAWEVVVVDNNCTDETPAVVERHRSDGLRVARVEEPEQGLTPARRRGILATDADWVAFVDDDCLVDPDWVAAALRFAAAHAACGAFGGRVVLEWEAEPPPVARRFDWAYAVQDRGDAAERVDFVAGAGMVVRRAALERSGWLEEPLLADRIGRRLVSGGDVEIALRIGAEHELWYVPECRLRHLVPRSRTTLPYLAAIVRGLGASGVVGDALVSDATYRVWLRAAGREAIRYARHTLATARLAARGRAEWADALLWASFLAGWVGGVWRLTWAGAERRRALLGRARAATTAPDPR